MDSHRCSAGTEIFLKSEKHGLYVYCCASSGFLLAIWPMSSARNVTLSTSCRLAFVRAESGSSPWRNLVAEQVLAWAIAASAGM